MDAQTQPEVRELAGFTLAGLALDCKKSDVTGIPGLWEKFFPFMQQHFMDQPVAWGACFENGDPEGFRYVCGCPWGEGGAPEGLERFEVPACSYVLHQFNGLPQEMAEHWRGVYQQMCAAAGREFNPDGPWLEEYRHDCYDEATGKITCTLYTPVK